MSKRDEEHAVWFNSGWDAAVREVFLRFDAGQMEQFRHEQRRALRAPSSPVPGTPGEREEGA